MALRDDIRNAMIAKGFDPDDETSATSPKYNARLFEAIAGVVKAESVGGIDWSTLTEYKTAGTYTKAVPSDCDKLFVIQMIGGGSGGAGGRNVTAYFGNYAVSYVPGQCGDSGKCLYNLLYQLPSGTEQINCIVGKGGRGTANNATTPTNAGGTTSIQINSSSGITLASASGGVAMPATTADSYQAQLGTYSSSGRDLVRSADYYNLNAAATIRPYSAGLGGYGGQGNRSGNWGGSDGHDGYLMFCFIRKA